MATVSVYIFTTSDLGSANDDAPPPMATLEAIERLGGTPLLHTAIGVNAWEVDSNGFYKRKVRRQQSRK
ncbi:MAG: hypothetical protein M3O26_19730 [Pseudomonadota bacterium]|nr:hypothetical protein [Pseudomonadota bacterium]